MLVPISSSMILLLISYGIYNTYGNKQRLTCMAGMMIAMTNAMMASIALGSILGTIKITAVI